MSALKKLIENVRMDVQEVDKLLGYDFLLEDAAVELAALTVELETVKRERDAAIALLWKMVKEEPCDNDGRGCTCVDMAYDFIVFLKAGKA